jgi:hypothetical protein
VQDQGDHGEYQQQMYQSSRNMKHCEAAKPCDQQHDEQYGPDTHLFASTFEMSTTLDATPSAGDMISVEAASQPVITRHLVSAGDTSCTFGAAPERASIDNLRRQPWLCFGN